MQAGNQLIETFFNRDTQRFYSPAKWFWGASALERGIELISELDYPLLVVDSALVNHPTTRSLAASCNWSNCIVLNGITLTERCHELAPQLSAANSIVTVGGGSTIDTVKAALAEWLYGNLDGVGMGARRGESPIAGRNKPLLISFPSTCGAGAEASRYYVTYRESDHAKVHGKSWTLVADWIFGDPAFLANAPLTLLVETAFDAFVHFWESYHCQHEAGPLSKALSLHGMDVVLQSLPRAQEGDKAALSNLIYAGTLGGVAISNVRTGHIHEAAGSLLEASELSHGATLFVFFAAALEQFCRVVAADSALTNLIYRHCGNGQDTVSPLVDWWQSNFEKSGSLTNISAELSRVNSHLLQQSIISRVTADHVWCKKESPIALDTEAIEAFVVRSLGTITP
jgi:alcohol dehydrogenase class IV